MKKAIYVPMGEYRKVMEIYIKAMICAGITLEEAEEALHTALVEILGTAADQLEALDTAMKAVAAIAIQSNLELLKQQEQDKSTHLHPCPDAGYRRRPENVRMPQTFQCVKIRPQARSTIKQHRNRRRE